MVTNQLIILGNAKKKEAPLRPWSAKRREFLSVQNSLAEESKCDSQQKSLGTGLHLKCFVSVSLTALFKDGFDDAGKPCPGNPSESHQFCIYAREKRRGEEFGVAVAHFLPPSTPCCLFLGSVVGFPGVGSVPLR